MRSLTPQMANAKWHSLPLYSCYIEYYKTVSIVWKIRRVTNVWRVTHKRRMRANKQQLTRGPCLIRTIKTKHDIVQERSTPFARTIIVLLQVYKNVVPVGILK